MFRLICAVLTICFVLFKVLGVGMVATWPWWLVLLPLWIIPAIMLGLLSLPFIAGMVAGILAFIFLSFGKLIDVLHLKVRG